MEIENIENRINDFVENLPNPVKEGMEKASSKLGKIAYVVYSGIVGFLMISGSALLKEFADKYFLDPKLNYEVAVFNLFISILFYALGLILTVILILYRRIRKGERENSLKIITSVTKFSREMQTAFNEVNSSYVHVLKKSTEEVLQVKREHAEALIRVENFYQDRLREFQDAAGLNLITITTHLNTALEEVFRKVYNPLNILNVEKVSKPEPEVCAKDILPRIVPLKTKKIDVDLPDDVLEDQQEIDLK